MIQVTSGPTLVHPPKFRNGAFRPGPHLGVFVGGVVVHGEVAEAVVARPFQHGAVVAVITRAGRVQRLLVEGGDTSVEAVTVTALIPACTLPRC